VKTDKYFLAHGMVGNSLVSMASGEPPLYPDCVEDLGLLSLVHFLISAHILLMQEHNSSS